MTEETTLNLPENEPVEPERESPSVANEFVDPEISLRSIVTNVREALKQAWPYILVGMSIGVVCSVLAHVLNGALEAIKVKPGLTSLKAASAGVIFGLQFLLHHLSVGFFVSSIAVFFYEWGSHAKSALRLSQELGHLLQKQGEASVESGMRGMFKEPKDKELLKHHREFIGALRKLDQKKNRGREADVAFLTLFVEHAAKFGGQLLTLRRHLWGAEPGDELGRQFHLDFTKFDYADKILLNWMNLLGKGDSYVTMSNPRTWSALKSGHFKEAGVRAVARGAKMRRIFIMGRSDDQHSTEDLRNLIGHYQFAVSSEKQGDGSYEIQIAAPTVFEPLGVKPEDQHYGIFTAHFAPDPEKERMAVAFKVVGAEVENFELVAVGRGGKLERNFEDIWASLQSSTDGPLVGKGGRASHEGAGRFLNAVMTREVGFLKSSEVRLEIVSNSDSWTVQHDLPDFWKAIEAVPVRHLFVPEDDDAATLTASRNMAADVRAAHGSNWEIKVCVDKLNPRQRKWLAPRWQFIDADGRPLHGCVFTLNCEDDYSDFFLVKEDSPTQATDYTMNFKLVWDLEKNEAL